MKETKLSPKVLVEERETKQEPMAEKEEVKVTIDFYDYPCEVTFNILNLNLEKNTIQYTVGEKQKIYEIIIDITSILLDRNANVMPSNFLIKKDGRALNPLLTVQVFHLFIIGMPVK